MIWQQEETRKQRNRIWVAFVQGCGVTIGVILLVAIFVVRLTGGINGGCP